MKFKLISLSFFLYAGLAFGQREPSKTLTFDNNVDDLIIVPFNGVAVVSEGDKLHGYNPAEEKILWSIDAPKRNGVNSAANILTTGSFGGASLDFTTIEDTPFIQKFFDDQLYIYNSINGDLLFASEGKERFFQAEYLFDENALLLRGLDDKNLIIAKYSLGTKEILWSTTVSTTYGAFLQTLGKLSGNDAQGYMDIMEYSEDKIFALIKSKFYVLDKSSGSLLWKDEENKISDFRTSLDGEKLITVITKGLLRGKSEIELYEAKSGKKIWKDPITTKYLVLFEDWQDKMLLAHYKGFNFYDYATGEKTWKKDPKGKGIKSVIPIDKDFLYVYDDEMMLIDKNGQKLWKSDVKICDDEEDPIFFLEKTNNNRVLYVTATYANMVDYTTGKKFWKGNLKLNEKRPTIAKYDEKSGDFIIFNDEELYRFNQNTDEKPKPYAKLKLKSEKLISSMELFPNNVSISGQSEVVGVDNSGAVLFHNKYTQPGEFGRRLLKTTAIVGQVAGSVASAEATATTSYRDSEGNQVTQTTTYSFGKKAQAIGKAGFYAGAIGQTFVQDRYLAMQETDNYTLIFAKGETGEKLLIKVNKETGEEIDKIILENNKPIYDIDYVSDDIYYSKGKEVRIFKGK
ncbi:outer membrane protein assembly factor BamB family protein [Cellulophaga baltica]|uniref:outer membrane protein assembly factor BamB family protein n=1 Tax=Cellulophaga baltica TaxID=76594 RepID=UPI0015F63586|nr:PQQ-binding-like beta-propeller repeat protein [Cellulophaga baltica]MBA6313619.1 PQQ-binding-like beta-propeller repeat protein [Cellulophaga baltica]